MTNVNAAGLSDRQLEELRRLLLAKRNELITAFDRRTEELAAGEEREPEEMDRVEAGAGRDEHARRTTRDSDLLGEIEAALARFDDGSYGLGEESREPIGYERLKAVPWARRTVREEEELELSSPRTRADRR